MNRRHLAGSLVSNVLGFSRLLRGRGIPVGPREAGDALRALDTVDLLDRLEVYLALRSVLVDSHEHFDRFDVAFREFWGPPEIEGEPGTERETPERISSDEPEPDQTPQALLEWLDERESGDPAADMPAYSAMETLTRKDFSALTADELDAIAALATLIARRIATRVSRRYRAARRSHFLDVRRTVRHSLRRGGEIIELLRRRRRVQRSQVVLLCDVSGSMDLYSRFLIQFIYALHHAVSRIETFVFSTSLTRVTDALEGGNLREALDRAARTVPNWSGGTKIGHSLRQFLDEHGRRLLTERTIVLIISDGWDTGEVEALAEAMRELNRRSARLIWLNPLLGGAGYEPLCQGMRAALPHVDVFAPAHNLESLRRLERHLAA